MAINYHVCSQKSYLYCFIDVFCLCRQGEFGVMISCDNPTCTVKWFHMECVGLSSAPDGDWISRICKGANTFMKDFYEFNTIKPNSH